MDAYVARELARAVALEERLEARRRRKRLCYQTGRALALAIVRRWRCSIQKVARA
jgi:hypothetical protein